LPSMTFPIAFAIGFSIASIPGPIITLVVTETLRKGLRAGVLTMLAPVLLDAVLMVPLGLLLQASLFSGKGGVFLGFMGAALLTWLGYQSMRTGRRKDEGERRKDEGGSEEIPSFVKGVLAHLTSPYPYLYWGTVGSTFIRQGYEAGGAISAALFPLGFWSGAIAFTLVVTYLVARGRKMLPARLEPHLHRLSGILLIGSGLYLAWRVWHRPF